VVDLTKPCVKCGAVNRFPCGSCIDCRKARKAIALAGNRPCTKCGARDRYKNGDCRPCSQTYNRSPAETRKVCMLCGLIDRYPSGQCKPCQKRRKTVLAKNKTPCKKCGSIRRWVSSGMCAACGTKKAYEYRSTAGFIEWQKRYRSSGNRREQCQIASRKFRKVSFEFSIEKQIKGLK
jgi:hypothetical protein